MRNKLMLVSITLLVGIALIGTIFTILWKVDFDQVLANTNPTYKELAQLSMDTAEITTNLYSEHFIVAQFNITVNNKKAYKELEAREPEVTATIITILSGFTADDLRGPEGLQRASDTIQEKLNEMMETGRVVRVISTDWRIQ